MLTLRENTKPVYAKGVKIGGGGVVVQSMCNTKTADVSATLEQINGLVAEGCEIVRLAVPDMEAAKAFDKIVHTSCNFTLVIICNFFIRIKFIIPSN